MRINSVEFFESTIERCTSCDATVMDSAQEFEHNGNCSEMTETESGWFYWNCQPGCLPDSEPMGPFESMELAVQDARDNDFIPPAVWTLDNTECSEWFERDRAHVCLKDATTDETIFELWDESVSQFVEDGFKSNRQSWHDALVEYANEHQLGLV